MMEILPFTVSVPDEELDELRRRIVATRWPEEIPGAGWDYGTNKEYLVELLDYWAHRFDWRIIERRLNAFPQFTTTIDGQTIHFLHVKSGRTGAKPLLLLHGWPSSVVEFLDLIGPLSDPASYGADADDAFDLIVPSLPGYGFGGPTLDRGWDPVRMADALAELMTGLGYEKFYSQGGDWGSVVSSRLGIQYPDRVLGLHLTFVVAGGPPADGGELTDEEKQIAAEQEIYNAREQGYIALQSTKPQTIAYSLVDSPAGLASWLVEKYRTWSDNSGNVEEALTKDQMLANISVYWFTKTGGSSGRLYFELLNRAVIGPNAERVEVPVSVAIGPRELYRATRRIAENQYNIVRWTELPHGGHFPAWEHPEQLAADIREALRDQA
jgi:microsomal epoxide hydrolase